jgi:hypothetical protein
LNNVFAKGNIFDDLKIELAASRAITLRNNNYNFKRYICVRAGSVTGQ